MSDLVSQIGSAREITSAAQRLRECALSRELSPTRVIAVLERWGEALTGPTFDAIPGVAFLRLWLRRGTLEPIVVRELGAAALQGEWREDRGARLRPFPLGVVGHWPAGNIEIQPLLSLTCGLLGGNACLVRVPRGLVTQTRTLIERLQQVDAEHALTDRIFMAVFEHERADLQGTMAAAVDGAMLWGGEEAVSQVRALPFPHWARIAVFGPRISVAAMGADTWGEPGDQEGWCRRIARDVWQFDQQACSSPQALFLERRSNGDAEEFVVTLADAFRVENHAHPRQTVQPALTSAICLSRAAWLLGGSDHRAVFPDTPDWTILLGEDSKIPQPTQGRTLSVLVVDDLLDAISNFDGSVQTLGLAVRDSAREAALALAAGRNGVDRIVKLGRMHVFGSPWDGTDLIKPMMRLVRYLPSGSE
jgi:hypothetical protein